MAKDDKPERTIKVTFNFENLGVSKDEAVRPSDQSKTNPQITGPQGILLDEGLVIDFSKLRDFDHEKRIHKRVQYWGPIILHCKDKPVSAKAVAKDINLGGIGLATTTDQIEVGTELVAEFKGSGSLKPFSVDCVVVRLIDQDGNTTLGLQVTKLGRLAESTIKAYIDNYDEKDEHN
ncbi:MAG: PilZ domain-containing protein [Bdellovibrionaceae bacterium]|nr:PilZ domain-containing protein [Bdellovibrionales bacterium]MCB9086692.1 PilZ domain-containing protein [Pseudobdellovibrionaceae bacterium]